MATDSPVVILGAGINGAALARELILNHVPVTVVDNADIASGTSAYSSRLIHGGLRYLEYGEFDLVRESLEERNRLLLLAPQFVRPLRLYIPVANRFGSGWVQAARFLGLPGGHASSRGRGLYVVRAGLSMYDLFAQDRLLPRQSLHEPGESGVPNVTSQDVRWLCAYSDAQICHAERFVVALLEDARDIAQEHGVPFRLLTYHEAIRGGDTVGIRPVGKSNQDFVSTLSPAAIVNATGAWVDETLRRLHVPSTTLIGGTKGSHFVTFHPGLRTALRGGGIYTEAADGRPIFVLPFGEGVLVGTTDLPFAGDPATAIATEEELEYLTAAVNRLFTHLDLKRTDIALHYAGVRPLPRIGSGAPAGITRRHLWHWHSGSKVPMLSLIGGKLTTCRAFAEQTARELLPKLGHAVEATSRERLIRSSILSPAVAEAARHAIRNQWATRLSDLIERRLMLLFERELSQATLRQLAEVLVAEKKLVPGDVDAEVAHASDRLLHHFGRRLG
jgi:glycerol-3-phosphate dehydrogenase